MRRRTGCPNENWTSDKALEFLKKKANKEVRKHNANDLKKIADGFKKIYVPDPTRTRCLIEKWVKDD
jgi:hypothetical protein